MSASLLPAPFRPSSSSLPTDLLVTRRLRSAEEPLRGRRPSATCASWGESGEVTFVAWERVGQEVLLAGLQVNATRMVFAAVAGADLAAATAALRDALGGELACVVTVCTTDRGRILAATFAPSTWGGEIEPSLLVAWERAMGWSRDPLRRTCDDEADAFAQESMRQSTSSWLRTLLESAALVRPDELQSIVSPSAASRAA